MHSSIGPKAYQHFLSLQALSNIGLSSLESFLPAPSKSAFLSKIAHWQKGAGLKHTKQGGLGSG